MATAAGTLVDHVLARVRDPGGVGTSRATVRTLLDYVQRTVNTLRPGWVVAKSATIGKRQVLVPIAQFADGSDPLTAPLCLRVMRVTHEGRDLAEVHWRTFGLTDRRWLQALGPRPRLFARIGRDHLAIVPGGDSPTTVTIYYAGVPPTFGDDSTESPLRDDRMAAVKLLTEVLVLLRQQDFEHLPEAMAQFRGQLNRLPPVRGA